MEDVVNLAELKDLERDGLERVFRESPAGPMPRGRWHGYALHELPTPRSTAMRLAEWLLFERVRFGVDFDRGVWFFGHPRITAAHFRTSWQPSRWRDTSVVALDYSVSRLPQRIRESLYDEVKPLTERLCLGLGGVNAPAGQGEHFFFALHRPA